MRNNNDFENLKRLGNSADQFVGNVFGTIGSLVFIILAVLFGVAGFRVIVWLFQQITGTV